MKKVICRILASVLTFAFLFFAFSPPAKVTDSPVLFESRTAAAKSTAEPHAAARCGAEACNSDDGGGCACGRNPFIVVPGITDSDVALLDAEGNPVLREDGRPYVKGGFMLDEDEIMQMALRNLAWPLARMLITQKDNGFTDAVYDTAKAAFWRQATNKDGTPVQNLKVVRYEKSFAELSDEEIDHLFINIPLRSICETIGYDHVYYFSFNIIGDPMQTARELDEFIQLVKEQTGHDKVDILNVSLGASIFTAYAEQFKDKGDVEKIVNAVALLNGATALRDLFAGDLNLGDESLYKEFLPELLAAENLKSVGYLANLLIRIFPKQVLLDTLDAVLNGAMDSMIRCAPNFWAMLPEEDYPAMADKWISGPEYAVLRQKTDAFYQAQLNFEENQLYMVQQKGASIHNVCGYGLSYSDISPFLGIVASDKTTNSDGVIHVQSTSMGATAAPAGRRLSDEYLNAHAGSRYISPDKGLDASTCLFPDRTWFFYNQDHEEAGKNAACMNLVAELFTNPNLVDVYSDPERFPQFNTGSDSKEIRRWLLPDAKKALEAYEAGELEIGPEDLAELNAAIAEAEDVLKVTIGDRQQAEAATNRLKNALIKIGVREAPKEKETGPAAQFFLNLIEALLKVASDSAYEVVGPQGYSDRFCPRS